MDTYLLSKLLPEDREHVEMLIEFMEAFGVPGAPPTPEGSAKRKAWIEADPDHRLAWLGLTRERAREMGYDV